MAFIVDYNVSLEYCPSESVSIDWCTIITGCWLWPLEDYSDLDNGLYLPIFLDSYIINLYKVYFFTKNLKVKYVLIPFFNRRSIEDSVKDTYFNVLINVDFQILVKPCFSVLF